MNEDFEKELNQEEEREAAQDKQDVYGAADYNEDESEEDDDSVIGGDMYSSGEEGEDEIEEDLSEEELSLIHISEPTRPY